MALSASYPPDSATIISVNMSGPGDYKGGSQSLDFHGGYESNAQEVTGRSLNYDSNHTAESNSATSSPMTHKESMSTDGDSSDVHGTGTSETGTDITVPDGDQRESKSKESTAIDKKTEKKRMKRFRLTHNQTRYLMSEFTRQAHPDAAHRERLSREIPGLSPRQVQVWFQNRRAKLKRLTSDDRERMLRSRALPDDFDMAQALHSPYGNCPHPSSTSAPSTGTYCPPGLMPTSPVFAGGFKSYNDDYVTSPLSATSSPWNSYFPSQHIHPARRDNSPNNPPQTPSPGHPNPYMRSDSFPSPSQPLHSPLHHLQFTGPPHGRPRTVSLGSYPNGSYTSAPMNRNGPDPSTDSIKDGDSTFRSPPSPNSVSAGSTKRNEQGFEQQEHRSSPRVAGNAPLLPAALQLKTGDKDLKPAVQSAPLSISHGCEASPMSPHFTSSHFGVTYPNVMSTVSLPASPFYFSQGGKSPEEYDPFDNINHGLPDSLIDQGRPYTSTFQFAGAQ